MRMNQKKSDVKKKKSCAPLEIWLNVITSIGYQSKGEPKHPKKFPIGHWTTSPFHSIRAQMSSSTYLPLSRDVDMPNRAVKAISISIQKKNKRKIWARCLVFGRFIYEGLGNLYILFCMFSARSLFFFVAHFRCKNQWREKKMNDRG